MIYAAPGAAGAKVTYKPRYDNFIGGQWVAPVKGQYFDVVTPISGKVYTQAARSTAEDIELALDAAHAAADKWGKTSAAERSNVLLKIADRIEANKRQLVETDALGLFPDFAAVCAAEVRRPLVRQEHLRALAEQLRSAGNACFRVPV